MAAEATSIGPEHVGKAFCEKKVSIGHFMWRSVRT